MSTLTLSLLGPFQASLHNKPLQKFRTNRVQALLIFLAVEQKEQHRREALMELLWPGLPQKSAQVNLRQTLYQLRKMIPEVMGRDGETPALSAAEVSVSLLLTDRQTIQIHPDAAIDLDLIAFDTLAKQATKSNNIKLFEQAAELYRGDFLADFYLPDSETFEEWANARREAYRRQVLDVLQSLAGLQMEEKQFELAETAVRRQLSIDPLRDIAHRQLIELLARSGRRSDALIHFDDYCRLMADELGVEPSADITMLQQQIISGEFDKPRPLAPEKPEMELPISSERRKQLILVEKVKQAWVKGVLEDATAAMPLIQLTRENQVEAVDTPWQDIIPERENGRFISPNQSYHDLFMASDRALLILGTPGAGKTLALISLAQDLITLAETDSSQPVPVILNLSTWAESRPSLTDWVVEELTAKYQIPRKIGRPWVEKDELLLLLDGLDEMPAPAQAACIQAINQFRETQGLTGIVVCCRTDDYDAIGEKLRLGRAIGLRPLTTHQIETYLASGGEQWAGLKTAVSQDPTLQEMAQSPLMLNIMRLAYGEGNNVPANQSHIITTDLSSKDNETRRQHLFATYVQHMFHRRRTTSYTAKQTIEWLTWLAQKMFQHNQSVFLIERLQPSWLSNTNLRRLYLLISRLTTGIFISIFLWLSTITAIQTKLDVRFSFYHEFAILLKLPLSTSILLFFITLNFIWGILITIIDEIHYRYKESRKRCFSDWIVVIAIFTLVTSGTFTILISIDTVEVAFITGVSTGLIWAAIHFFILRRPGYYKEINSVESLKWSWKQAIKGSPLGIFLGASFSWLLFMAAHDYRFMWVSLLNIIIYVYLLAGLKYEQLEVNSIPNQGIRLSSRNSAKAALIFGLVTGIFCGLPWVLLFNDWALGINMAFFGILVGSITYGGIDTLKHLILRILLKWQGQIPWNYAQFLNEAAELALLRKVGGGYIFVHRLLQAYFAGLGASDEFVHDQTGVDERETAVSTPQNKEMKTAV